MNLSRYAFAFPIQEPSPNGESPTENRPQMGSCEKCKNVVKYTRKNRKERKYQNEIRRV